jgi:DNA-binding transcriptional MerR regulator
MKKLSIGEMATICNVSIQTLRYYDQIDLLKPQLRNPENNYRYYGVDQIFRVNIIKYLRHSELSIKEIKSVLKLDNSKLLSFWQEQVGLVDEQISQLKQTKRLVQGQVKQLEQLEIVKGFKQGEIYARNIPEEIIVEIRAETAITPLDYPDRQVSKLDQLLLKNNTLANLQYGFTYPLKNYQTMEEIEYSRILTQIFTTNTAKIKKYVKKIPAGKYLCIAFHWDRKKYFSYYRKLFESFTNQYEVNSPIVYEISTIDNYNYQNEKSFYTELRIRIP